MSGSRVIPLCDDITAPNAVRVISDMDALAAENDLPIVLLLDTNGGRVDMCMAIIDKINSLRCPVHTLGYGKIMSAGALILLSGKKGERMLSADARVMVHSPRGVTILDHTDTDISLINLYTRKINEMLLQHTKLGEEMIEKIMIGDLYLSASEALSFGIIDKII